MAEPAPVTRRVLPTAEALASAVASALTTEIATAQGAGRVPAIGLTGGSIAAAIHERLGEIGAATPVDWGAVDLWWGDERFVPTGAADRNDAGVLPVLAALGVPTERIHPMPAAESGDLDEAADRYAASWREHGAAEFEVLMLGIGPDGHIASLFPGRTELVISERFAVGVRDSPKPPPERISLTLPALNRARQVWFVASGAGKAAAVAAAQTVGPLAEIPARGVRGRVRTVWWLDETAASQL